MYSLFSYEGQLYIYKSALPLWIGMFITFNKTTAMFTVLCRHAHS